MWDGREPTLASQAVDATLVHAQRDTRPPPLGQGPLAADDPLVQEIVAFENGFFSAQQVSAAAGPLTDAGAKGGVRNLKAAVAKGALPDLTSTFNEYDAWADPPGTAPQVAARKSIRHGQDLFTGKNRRGRFTIADVPGFSDFPGVPNAAPGQSCTVCHNVRHGGSDALPNSQRNIGTTGDTAKGRPLRKDLPVFTVTCTGPDNPFLGHSFRKRSRPRADQRQVRGRGQDDSAAAAGLGGPRPRLLRRLGADAPGRGGLLRQAVLDRADGPGQKQDLANFLGAL